VTPHVTEVRFQPADDQLRATGLLGWVTCLLDGRIRIGGVAVRRTRGDRLVLSYPFRDDGWGRRWHYLRPIDDATRVSIERQVMAQVDLEEVAP
jgi:hypothetical protein